MSREQRQADYILKAVQAEQASAKAATPEARLVWLKIAGEYRSLAGTT